MVVTLTTSDSHGKLNLKTVNSPNFLETSQILLLSTGQYSSDTVLLSGSKPGNELQAPNPKELVCFQGNTATNQKSVADAIVVSS